MSLFWKCLHKEFASSAGSQRVEARNKTKSFFFSFFFHRLEEMTSHRAQAAFCDSCSLGNFIFSEFLVCPTPCAWPWCCYFTVSCPKLWIATHSELPIDFHRVDGCGRKETHTQKKQLNIQNAVSLHFGAVVSMNAWDSMEADLGLGLKVSLCLFCLCPELRQPSPDDSWGRMQPDCDVRSI